MLVSYMSVFRVSGCAHLAPFCVVEGEWGLPESRIIRTSMAGTNHSHRIPLTRCQEFPTSMKQRPCLEYLDSVAPPCWEFLQATSMKQLPRLEYLDSKIPGLLVSSRTWPALFSSLFRLRSSSRRRSCRSCERTADKPRGFCSPKGGGGFLLVSLKKQSNRGCPINTHTKKRNRPGSSGSRQSDGISFQRDDKDWRSWVVLGRHVRIRERAQPDGIDAATCSSKLVSGCLSRKQLKRSQILCKPKSKNERRQ